jgi:hypothetical protein
MLNVILDIDDTLVKHTKRDVWARVPNQSDFQTEPSRSGIFVLRPHLDEFMAYLFENHNVSLWTWSDNGYAHLVADILKRRYEAAHPGKTARFKDILAEEDADRSTTVHGKRGKDLHLLWYNFNQAFVDKYSKITPKNAKEESHKKIALESIAALKKRNDKIAATNRERVDNDEEPYFAGEKKFFTEYAPCNTILVDDADYNYVVPGTRENMIKIKPFGGHTETATTRGSVPSLDKNDTGLLKAIDVLKSIKPNCAGDAKHEVLFPDGGPKVGGRRPHRGLRTQKTRKLLKRRRLHERKRLTRRA